MLDDSISYVVLLADPSYCGISHLEQEEVCDFLRQDCNFWTYRSPSELMIHAAAEYICFLLDICHKVEIDSTVLVVYIVNVSASMTMDIHADWPYHHPIPDSINVEDNVPHVEIRSILYVPPRKVGQVIGRRGARFTN